MKKVILMVLFVSLATAGAAFAGTATAGQALKAGAAGAEDTPISRLSTGVGAAWNNDTGGYAIMTVHTSGSQLYATAHDSTNIYRKSGSFGDLAEPSASDSSAFEGSWEKM
jgi:TRAP-type C4-dicarboxylate transport system substrate-binding protein